MYDDFVRNRIAELRIQRNVSCREMSLALGQSEGYINSIENGHALPSMSVFFYICDYFNLTPQEFFDGAVERPYQLQKWLDAGKDLSEGQIDSILKFITANK